jgi:hypothetical protein
MIYNHTMTITWMSGEANIDDDLYNDPWCQSIIDPYSDITGEDTAKHYFTANEEAVWSLACDEINLPIICTHT